MRGLGSVLAGALALSALQVVVSTPAAGYLGEIVNAPARWLHAFVDPTRPLIPDVRNKTTKGLQTQLRQAYYDAGAGGYGPHPSTLPPATVPSPPAAAQPPLTA